jgi:fermentation-respiration switch protein FrsA (DUF1100 family)
MLAPGNITAGGGDPILPPSARIANDAAGQYDQPVSVPGAGSGHVMTTLMSSASLREALSEPPRPPGADVDSAIREDVGFSVGQGVTLRGWLYLPAGPGPHPAITMAHGYCGVREHGLDRFARVFAEAGFVVLVHDHRGFGHSDGEPRNDVDPWRQIADWRCAISYLEARPEVDADRIGLWGSSYAGGHALVLGATDRRLRAVVSQVPTTSGYQQSLRRVPPDQVSALETSFLDSDRRTFAGEPLPVQAVASADLNVVAAYRSPDAIAFFTQPIPPGVWHNEVTIRSTRAARMYEPGAWVDRVSPTPLMMIVGLDDTITVTALALDAYERALEPKKVVTLAGGHFCPYQGQFTEASAAARDWFVEHLA